MRFDVLTLFPQMIEAATSESMIGRARSSGMVQIVCHDIRRNAIGPYKRVDDGAYGGGPGQVMMCQPVVATMREVLNDGGEKPHLLLLTPAGKTFCQGDAKRLAKLPRIAMLCGHYEGLDDRIRCSFAWEELSIGDFILTGGEVAALVVIDAVTRLLPGVLGDNRSISEESFEGGLLEYPHFTRPAEFEGMKVPDVLLSGHHAEIEAWRRRQAEELTRVRRPDLWEKYCRSQGALG